MSDITHSAVQIPPFFVNITQLAAAIPASRRSVENWRNAGIIPFIQIGGLIRYDLAAVRAALESRFTIKASKDAAYKIRPRTKDKATSAK